MSLKKEIQTRIIHAVNTVRQTNPMAGSVTNSVTINFVANAQLAVGGSAAMVYLPDEARFLAQAGEAAYINVGTLTPIYETTPARHGANTSWHRETMGPGPRGHRHRRTSYKAFAGLQTV